MTIITIFRERERAEWAENLIAIADTDYNRKLYSMRAGGSTPRQRKGNVWEEY
jgi:hypothetical protein